MTTPAEPTAPAVAWITGASSGIGRALALELARRGLTVAASARRAGELEALAAEAAGLAGRIAAHPLDVTDAAACAATVARVEAECGPIEMAVLDAGVYLPVDGAAPDPEIFARSFAVNLQGTANGIAPLVAAMKPRRRGRIAVVASVAGYSGLPTSAAYGATKAGLINMAESLKFDLDRLGIRIQVVSPGFVETAATARNAFPMPFLLTAADAARRIADGLATDRFEIAFPRRFALWLKLARMLPYGVYFPLVRRLTGWPAGPG